jgi:NAD(P)-dependent dehydrogenase (short-subunit alcohol dehydrogenase family)
MKSLDGKTAFVTGAASGIGFGIATALTQAGVKVMLSDIDADRLDEAVATLKAADADVDGIVTNVSVKAEIKRAADATIARFGKVHILCNNAGMTGAGDYGTWHDAEWDWLIKVNLMSTVWGIEIFGPLIEAHGEGGHIVNTASLAGIIASTTPAYDATKFGVVALSEDLRPKLAERGIGVSVLCPGVVRTQSLANARAIMAKHAPDIPKALSNPEPNERELAMVELMKAAIEPVSVGEMVVDAIRNDWSHIFTNANAAPRIEARFDMIRQGLDRAKAWTTGA